MPTERDILQLLQQLRERLDGDVSLDALATRAGWSPFHFHRAFRRVVGETPKQYTQRLRLDRAAARLATSDDPVLSVASGAGFASHEVFTRAFRRQFGCAPTTFRANALKGAAPAAKVRHVALTNAAGPCVGLYHMAGPKGPALHTSPKGPALHSTTEPASRRLTMPMLSIERRELAPAHVLIARARCARHEISKAIGECLGKTFPYAMRVGATLAGRPFTRYTSVGPGLFTLEAGCVVGSPTPGEGDVEATTLPGGPTAVAMHAGSYDTLGETYAEMERWMEKNGLAPGGAPWESYITDPADHPNAEDWRTEIYWPLK